MNLSMTKVPIGAEVVMTYGEKPIVVTIDPKAQEFAELWITRKKGMAPRVQELYEEKAWLCLLNGALIPELRAEKASAPRYEPRPYKNAFSERDGAWCVVDTHTLSKFSYPPEPFAIGIHVDNKTTALKVANLLNQSEGYPKAKQYVEPPKKTTRRKNGSR